LNKLWLVILASLLAACSSSNKIATNTFRTSDTAISVAAELTTQLKTQQITPVRLSNLAFQMASLDSRNRIDITASSPVVRFPEGHSFVTALFLPEHITRFTFALESDASRTVFVPSVVFLNNDLQEVSRIDDAQFNGKGFYSIEKEFNTEKAQTIRYILVYSKNSDLDGRSELIDVAREYELSKGKVLPEHSFPKLYTKHSPIGTITVYFKDVFFSAQAINVRVDTEKAKPNKTNTIESIHIGAVPTILSDTEAFYLQMISKAVKEDNLSRAKNLVEEAERAGSKKAQSHYIEELEKQQ